MSWLKNRIVMPGLTRNVMPGLTGHLLALLLLSSLPLAAQENTILSGAEWSDETVAEGIVLHRASFQGTLFDSNQYICVLEVAPGARFDIVPAGDGILETTSFARTISFSVGAP